MKDSDLEWLAGLDWHLHGPLGTKFVTGTSGNMPIAKAALRLAEYAAGPGWPDGIPYFLSLAGNPPRGQWIEAEEAFGPDGKPTSLYHATLQLARTHADRFKVPLASLDAITPQEWDAISDAASQTWAEGEGARRMWWQLAPIIAQLAADREIQTFMRPIGGGDEEEPVERARWRLDPEVAIVRLANCAFDPAAPFDQNAKPTHRLFVSTIGLDLALQKAARDNYIPHAAVEHVVSRPIDREAPPPQVQMDFLRALMRQHRNWTKERLQTEVEERYGVEITERQHRRWRKQILDADPELAEDMRRTGPK